MWINSRYSKQITIKKNIIHALNFSKYVHVQSSISTNRMTKHIIYIYIIFYYCNILYNIRMKIVRPAAVIIMNLILLWTISSYLFVFFFQIHFYSDITVGIRLGAITFVRLSNNFFAYVIQANSKTTLFNLIIVYCQCNNIINIG